MATLGRQNRRLRIQNIYDCAIQFDAKVNVDTRGVTQIYNSRYGITITYEYTAVDLKPSSEVFIYYQASELNYKWNLLQNIYLEKKNNNFLFYSKGWFVMVYFSRFIYLNVEK